MDWLHTLNIKRTYSYLEEIAIQWKVTLLLPVKTSITMKANLERYTY